MKKTISLCLISLFVFGFCTTPAMAEEGTHNAFTKLGKGFLNVVTGWMELPIQMADREEDESAGSWALFGFFKGVNMTLQRTVFGAWDMVTFAFPPYNSRILEPPTLLDEDYHQSSTLHYPAR